MAGEVLVKNPPVHQYTRKQDAHKNPRVVAGWRVQPQRRKHVFKKITTKSDKFTNDTITISRPDVKVVIASLSHVLFVSHPHERHLFNKQLYEANISTNHSCQKYKHLAVIFTLATAHRLISIQGNTAMESELKDLYSVCDSEMGLLAGLCSNITF